MASRHNSNKMSSTNNMWSNFQFSKVSDTALVTLGMKESGSLTEDDESMSHELGVMMQLTYTQRVVGFAMTLAMGIIFICIAVFLFLPVVYLFPNKFAFFFTVGNIFCVGSTAFLAGPYKQIASMFEANRAQAAGVYVGSTFMTLMSIMYFKSSILGMIFAALQTVSVAWYALSYIPYARTTLWFAWRYASPILSPIISKISSLLLYLCGGCVSCICRGGAAPLNTAENAV